MRQQCEVPAPEVSLSLFASRVGRRPSLPCVRLCGRTPFAGRPVLRLTVHRKVKLETGCKVTFVIVQWLKILMLVYWESILISVLS